MLSFLPISVDLNSVKEINSSGNSIKKSRFKGEAGFLFKWLFFNNFCVIK